MKVPKKLRIKFDKWYNLQPYSKQFEGLVYIPIDKFHQLDFPFSQGVWIELPLSFGTQNELLSYEPKTKEELEKYL